MNNNIPKKRIALAAVLTVAVLGSAGYGWHHMNSQVNDLNAQLVSETKTHDKAEDEFNTTNEGLKNQVAELEKELQERDERLSSRDSFLASIEGINGALSSAEGKVDTAEAKQVINTAQEAVVTAANSTDIETQTHAVNEAKQALEAAIAAYVPPVVTPPRSSASSGSSSAKKSSSGGESPAPSNNSVIQHDPLANARAALDRVGGGWVALSMNECSHPQAAACATPGKVSIAGQYASQPTDWWYHIMMHEYAHQIQFQHWAAMASSATYQNLMNSDVEWLAECMARARIGDGYRTGRTNYSCNADQIAYGSRAWSGNFA